MAKLLFCLLLFMLAACAPKPVRVERLSNLPIHDSGYPVAVENFDTWNEADIDSFLCNLYMNSDTLWEAVYFYKYSEFVNAHYLNGNAWAYWRYASPDADIANYTIFEDAGSHVFLLNKNLMLVQYRTDGYVPNKTRYNRCLYCADAIKEKYYSGGYVQQDWMDIIVKPEQDSLKR